MKTQSLVKKRILELCEQKGWAIYKLATESAVPPSTLKGILRDNSKNPGIVTIKCLCDGFGISLYDFFNTAEFRSREQEMK